MQYCINFSHYFVAEKMAYLQNIQVLLKTAIESLTPNEVTKQREALISLLKANAEQRTFFFSNDLFKNCKYTLCIVSTCQLNTIKTNHSYGR